MKIGSPKKIYFHLPWLSISLIFVMGILFWGGLHWSIEISNTESFCLSCHEMRDNVYQEYKTSAHYTSRSGVRATCPDCHVPRTWNQKMARKLAAVNEIYHWASGSIDTREKFLKKRPDLAKVVWQTMENNDSAECRGCHEFNELQLAQQSSGARRSHNRGLKKGITCISCHKGISHQLPTSYWDDEHQRMKEAKRECGECHIGMPINETITW